MLNRVPLGRILLSAGLLLASGPLLASQPDELNSLVKAAHSSDSQERVEALERLLELGPAAGPAAGELAKLLAQAEPDDRLLIVELLGELGAASAPAVPALVKLLDSPEPGLVPVVIQALDQLGATAEPALAALDRLAAEPLSFQTVLALAAGASIRRAMGDDTREKADRARLVELLDQPDPKIRREAIAALTGFGPAALEPLLKHAQQAEAEDQLDLIEAIARWGSAAETALPWLIELSGGSDPVLKRAATGALGSFTTAGPKAAEPLIALLSDGDASVRAEAAEALGRVGQPGDEATLEALLAHLADPDEWVRLAVIDTLGHWAQGGAPLLPKLLAALGDVDAAVAARAVTHLAELGPQAAPGLVTALEDERARPWAVILIAELGPAAAEAVPALLEAATDPRPEVRREALLALGKFPDAASRVVPIAMANLADEDLTVRYAAAGALGMLGPAAVPAEAAIRGVQRETTDEFLKAECAWVRARMHPNDRELQQQAVEALIGAMQQGPPRLRIGAARALVELNADPEVVLPALSSALTAAEPEMVQNAVEALADLGPTVVPRVRRAISIENLRSPALAVLAQLGPQAADAVPEVIGLLTADAEPVRQQALLTLAAMGPKAQSAVAAVAGLLADKSPELRSAAAYALGSIGPPAQATVPRLIQQLKDPDEAARIVAAWALLYIAPKQRDAIQSAVPVLTKALRSRRGPVRGEVVLALANLDPALLANFESLRAEVARLAAGDTDPQVRAEARSLLETWK